MTYLITEIFLLLLASALIGLLVGWYLARVSAHPTRQALVTKVKQLEARLNEAQVGASAPTAKDAGLETSRKPAEAVEAARPVPAKRRVPAAAGAATGGAQAPPPATPDAGAPDDLRRIKGIGPKIAGILDDIGIRHYEQIAAWTPDNVAWVNDYLKFKGRIEREQWIPQARALIAEREDRGGN
jgi:predicted flap endonuclease-1-like 5' DNA nuclease